MAFLLFGGNDESRESRTTTASDLYLLARGTPAGPHDKWVAVSYAELGGGDPSGRKSGGAQPRGTRIRPWRV